MQQYKIVYRLTTGHHVQKVEAESITAALTAFIGWLHDKGLISRIVHISITRMI